MTDTNKMRDPVREQFEKWKNYPLPPLNSDGQYDKEWLQREWLAWQASRQAVVVELPSFYGYRDFVVRELQAAFTGACETQGLRCEVKP